MGRKRRSFSAEFKAEAVSLCRVGDRSIKQVAKDLDLTETALREWVRRAGVDAGEGPPGPLTTVEREELSRLRKQVKRLEMEREILKKAAVRSNGHRNTRVVGVPGGATWTSWAVGSTEGGTLVAVAARRVA
jgi:transposase